MSKYLLEYDDCGNLLISDEFNKLGFVIMADRLERGIERETMADMLKTLDDCIQELEKKAH